MTQEERELVREERERITEAMDRIRAELSAATQEIERFRAEAAVEGKTFFHSDDAVSKEMGRLRAEVEKLTHRSCALQNTVDYADRRAERAEAKYSEIVTKYDAAADKVLALQSELAAAREHIDRLTEGRQEELRHAEEIARREGIREGMEKAAEIAGDKTIIKKSRDGKVATWGWTHDGNRRIASAISRAAEEVGE